MGILGEKTTKQTNLAFNCFCVCAYLHSKPLRPSLWRLIVTETLNSSGSPKISKTEGKLRSTYFIFTEVRKNNCWGLNETCHSTYTTCVIWSPSVINSRISRKKMYVVVEIQNSTFIRTWCRRQGGKRNFLGGTISPSLNWVKSNCISNCFRVVKFWEGGCGKNKARVEKHNLPNLPFVFIKGDSAGPDSLRSRVPPCR